MDIAESEFRVDTFDSTTKLEPIKLSIVNYIEACKTNWFAHRTGRKRGT